MHVRIRRRRRAAAGSWRSASIWDALLDPAGRRGVHFTPESQANEAGIIKSLLQRETRGSLAVTAMFGLEITPAVFRTEGFPIDARR